MDWSRREVLGLAAGGALVALKPENPVVGGTVLRRAAIQSPNFLTGVSGWTINQDGSAEFNNLTIRGTFQGTNFVINTSGAFFYSSTPALGNLIGSITTAAGTDALGNTYLAGITGYSSSGGVFYAASIGPAFGGSSVLGIWTAPSAGGSYTFQGGLSADTSGNMTLGAAANLTLNTTAGALRGTRTALAFAGYLPLVQVDISTNGPGNTAAATDITKAWSIPANDAVAGTTYTIRGLLTVTTGPTTIETLTIGADIAGTKTALATLGTAFNGGALSTTYAIPFELVMIVDAVSAGTPEVYLNAPLGDTSANRLSTNSANLQGFSHAASFAKASGGTFAAYAQWGGTGGTGQLAQTIASRLYREGP